MKLSLSSIWPTSLIVISAMACGPASDTLELNFVTEIETTVHANSSLVKSKSIENYLEIGKGKQTIYELTKKDDIEGALDAVSWRKTLFHCKQDFQLERIYYLQNDDELNSFSFRGGAWNGIEKLYGTRGTFKLMSITDTSLLIKVLGDWQADRLKGDSIEHITIVSDTTLLFKK